MLILKIIFGLIVTLPILLLAEYLFEQTVDDALIGTYQRREVLSLRDLSRIERKRDGITRKNRIYNRRLEARQNEKRIFYYIRRT